MAMVSHCLNASTFRRYCNSQIRNCFSRLCVTHHVSLLNRALTAEELSHALIFFAAVPCFLRFLKFAQKHVSACASRCFMLALVFPSLSIMSPSICVLSAFGMGAMMLSAMLCSVKESLSKWWVDRVTDECSAYGVHGFHSNPALCSARVTSFIISWASVGFLPVINM